MNKKKSNKIEKELFKSAKRVLDDNWISLGRNKGYTVLAHGLYPFQWNWDSGFVAYGYAHYNIQRAIAELRSLFSGQWSNGMLPHMILHKKGYYEYYSPKTGEGLGAKNFSWSAALVIDILNEKGNELH